MITQQLNERSQLVNFSQKENYRPIYFCIFVYKCLNNPTELDLVLNHLKIDMITILETNKTLHLNYLRQTEVFSKLSHTVERTGTPSTWKPETLTTSLPLRNQLLRFFLSIIFFYFAYTFVIFYNLLYTVLDILIIYLFIFLTFRQDLPENHVCMSGASSLKIIEDIR